MTIELVNNTLLKSAYIEKYLGETNSRKPVNGLAVEVVSLQQRLGGKGSGRNGRRGPESAGRLEVEQDEREAPMNKELLL